MLRVGVILITAVLITTTLIAVIVPSDQTPALTSYVLSIDSTAGGNVTSPGVGDFTYYEGTVVYLMATPHAGYHFVDWTGNVSTISNINRAATGITINGSYSITANFEEDPPVQYMLAILSAPGGSVIVPGEGTFTYDVGAVVNLVATPGPDYKFLKWSGDVDAVADVNAVSTNITMSGNHTYILVCANFQENPPVCGVPRD
jgi:Divergent InlB B-repeat domain